MERERAKNTAFGVAELQKTEHHKLFLQMGTHSGKKLTITEAHKGASASDFTWFYPGCYFSEPKPGLNSLQGTQVGQESGLPVTPIRSIPHSIEPADNVDSGSKPAKVKKRKPSTKGSNEISSKATRPKQSKRKMGPSFPVAKREKKDLNIDMDPSCFDFSGVPSPICSCTGVARVCYKWGAGGWQSSCCTISISEYPLPMSTSRPGSRMAGRKMSNGAYGKLILRLASEGYDLSYPVDLKEHWARHGTNKFVTIK